MALAVERTAKERINFDSDLGTVRESFEHSTWRLKVPVSVRMSAYSTVCDLGFDRNTEFRMSIA